MPYLLLYAFFNLNLEYHDFLVDLKFRWVFLEFANIYLTFFRNWEYDQTKTSHRYQQTSKHPSSRDEHFLRHINQSLVPSKKLTSKNT